MARPWPRIITPGPRRRRSWSRAMSGALYGPDRIMTTLSPETISPAGSPAERLARLSRLILLARASLALERFLPGLWPALGFAALYLSAALLGLFAFVPWILQAVILAVTVTAIGLSLAGGFEHFAWPNWKDG